MKAVAYQKSLPISEPQALVDVDLPAPQATGRDLLVKIEAISVNPVDYKIRKNVAPEAGEFKVLGWDASGTVEQVGAEVRMFAPGDRVWYAGAIDRAGANAEFHLVDERIVSKMPQSLDFAEAAAMPLTTITAWEILFDRFGLNQASTGTLLIIGGAGGVGSMMIQLAKQLTRMSIIATASRPETISWVRQLGADEVIDHHAPFASQLAALGYRSMDYVASLTHTGEHFAQIVEIIAPQGHFSLIDDPAELNIMPLKTKSVAIHWELMFTRSLFQTDDMIEQHQLLAQTARLVDEGVLKTTLNQKLGTINAANLIKAHSQQESGTVVGKTVLEGFE